MKQHLVSQMLSHNTPSIKALLTAIYDITFGFLLRVKRNRPIPKQMIDNRQRECFIGVQIVKVFNCSSPTPQMANNTDLENILS